MKQVFETILASPPPGKDHVPPVTAATTPAAPVSPQAPPTPVRATRKRRAAARRRPSGPADNGSA